MGRVDDVHQRRRPPAVDDGGRERARLAPEGRRGRGRRPARRAQGPGDRRVRDAARRASPPTTRSRRSCASTSSQQIGALARPEEIRFAEALPKTRSGKIMRRLLREVASGIEGARRHDDARRSGRARAARAVVRAGRVAIVEVIAASRPRSERQEVDRSPRVLDSRDARQAMAGSAPGRAPRSSIPPYTPAADVPAPIKAAIAATDRSDDDRALDAGRKPGEVLAFFKLAPGQKIGELFAGGGYTTRADGARRRRQRHTCTRRTRTRSSTSSRASRWTERAREAGDEERRRSSSGRPTIRSPPDAQGTLDAVIVRPQLSRLRVAEGRPREDERGRVRGAQAGRRLRHRRPRARRRQSATRDVETLHRIDEEVVKQEVTAAGFKLDATSDVLRNPDDKRDWNSSPKAAAEATSAARAIASCCGS